MLDVRGTVVQPVPASRYHLSLAVDDSEIREAQRLRYQVFADEMGARLSSALPGHDTDLYDPFCDHLLVRDLANGEVVGTYRFLPPDAASVHRQLRERHLAPIEWHAAPRTRLPVESLDDGRIATLPPLIKGYTRLGAMVCGEPAWDPDFNTADLLMLLPMAQLNRSYARRLIA
jgi:putative hemolysin